MKLILAMVMGLAAAGSVFIMCSLMSQYAAELETERKFIMSSKASIRNAFSEFEAVTEVLLSAPSNETTTRAKYMRQQLDKTKSQSSGTASIDISDELSDWTTRFLGPSLCGQHHRRNIFHLHMRKAAGTTIRNYLQSVTKKTKQRYFESEGISLSRDFKQLDGTTTVLSLRHPLDRIFSLYWYEHVAWWNEVKKDMSKCSTMKNWVEAWRDGSSWKTEFIKNNPGSTYVEIENYYTKTLSGWKGPEKVTRDDLAIAKKALQNFDVVVISEWLSNKTQKSFLNSVFKNSMQSNHNQNHGNPSSRQKLKASLLPEAGEAQIARVISDLNDLDLELWDFASNLASSRLKMHHSFSIYLKHDKSVAEASIAKMFMASSGFSCFKVPDAFSVAKPIPPYLAKQVGIFRPPLHKGPI